MVLVVKKAQIATSYIHCQGVFGLLGIESFNHVLRKGRFLSIKYRTKVVPLLSPVFTSLLSSDPFTNPPPSFSLSFLSLWRIRKDDRFGIGRGRGRRKQERKKRRRKAEEMTTRGVFFFFFPRLPQMSFRDDRVPPLLPFLSLAVFLFSPLGKKRKKEGEKMLWRDGLFFGSEEGRALLHSTKALGNFCGDLFFLLCSSP